MFVTATQKGDQATLTVPPSTTETVITVKNNGAHNRISGSVRLAIDAAKQVQIKLSKEGKAA